MNKLYYHGSVRKIQGDRLMPRGQWNSVQNARVNGAFVTTDINHAKFFALNGCLGRGQTKQSGNKIYLEQLADKIKPYFYVYTVYEPSDSAFIHDRGTEYYSEKPIKIANVQKCDTVAELDKLGWEFYVLDEPFNVTDGDKNRTDNSVKQNYMATAIEYGKYHRVDIAKLLRDQKKNTFKTASNNLKNKMQNLWHRLQKLSHNAKI